MKIGYIRVSTQEQNTIRQEALMESLGVDEVYIDRMSGKNAGRPELRRMLEYVRKGDTVIVESISRFARNTRDLLELVENLTTKGVEFVSQKESIDTTTPTGKFMLTVFETVAKRSEGDRPWRDGLRCLPQVSEYECRHLAARLEQEIYRCALRNPDCESDIHVFLFCPPERVWELLRQRFWGCKVEEYEDLPDCVEAVCARAGIYGGHPTAYAKLAELLEAWDGVEVKVSALKKRLGITDSAWKELIKGEKAKALLARHGVERRGRGPNAVYYVKHHDLCA